MKIKALMGLCLIMGTVNAISGECFVSIQKKCAGRLVTVPFVGANLRDIDTHFYLTHAPLVKGKEIVCKYESEEVLCVGYKELVLPHFHFEINTSTNKWKYEGRADDPHNPNVFCESPEQDPDECAYEKVRD